ncbi:cell division protein FtsL [Bisgaard Taxon 10/6]|uniref:Cell division protein FtsL n=1 Tax=Exercitatus varius TaxID=67857 RepID=A0AAW6Q627_9PAST|nr:cell division protein FtsL [Exercitatus varius]QOF68887.1 cell division protein FtsL [Actinobacillus sp. GY-402]MDG2915876.1 cell division protein FtsL [Exercitatus varius]MDG2918256.1 cell division protein FtsL [Exercitatus varius]MDG2939466.1 cell division protein FtsL [Exercitatus varius]MDG2940978.1 cell division protein FtsL [Exercitatus varius]
MSDQPLLNSERYPLQDLIIQDLCELNKTVIALILAITCTAIGTVWITHQTRMLVAEKGELVFEKQALENEFVNLKLEETTLSDNTRIEAISTVKLGMKRVEPEQEVVILE